MVASNPDPAEPDIWDVVVVGAGFSGLYVTYRMREMGLSVRTLEQGSDVGGTWFWNRYPGARCDMFSYDYSYSFSKEVQDEWSWTERYGSGPEILRYIHYVADRFDLRKHVQLDTSVTQVAYDDGAGVWRTTTDAGDVLTSRFVIMASGVLSRPKPPDIDGIEDFEGLLLRSSSWPESIDLTGKRVGVIGTGSTGIQIIPAIAPEVAELVVFQRSPNFSVPAVNKPVSPEEMDQIRATYDERRAQSRLAVAGFPDSPHHGSALDHTAEEREAIFEEAWNLGGGPRFLRCFNDIVTNPESNAYASDFARRKIRSIVADPAVAELLCPHDHPLGARRLCLDHGYYETYNRANVRLVDVRSAPIERFDATGLVTADGTHHDLDVVVLATGFDAVTGALLSIDIRGRAGLSLRDKWSEGPEAFLGIAMHGFPNLFTVIGPGSPSILGNVVTSIEQHVDLIADALSLAEGRQASAIEVRDEAEKAWTRTCRELASTMLMSTTRSWYNGGNIPGKPNVILAYTGGVGAFRGICDEERDAGFPGFELTT